MNGKMTAAVLYGKEDLKIERVPIPRVDKGEVLVKVQVALTVSYTHLTLPTIYSV